MDIKLLKKFYDEACEHELCLADRVETWDRMEYDHYMIELRRMIRFFYSLEKGDL